MQYIGVIAAILAGLAAIALGIGYVMQKRLRKTVHDVSQPFVGNDFLDDLGGDAIIAVRKKTVVNKTNEEPKIEIPEFSVVYKGDSQNNHPDSRPTNSNNRGSEKYSEHISALYVMAKEGQSFTGYELLQALLSAGLRYGEMSIFHRYQEPNIQKGILFSLASATEPGTFDMQNIGAFSCCGLTLFLRKLANEDEGLKHYEMMLRTARQLTEDLDGILMDHNRKPMAAEETFTAGREENIEIERR